MKGNEGLMIERDEIKERISATGNEIEEHLKTNHGGKPSSSCHKCINFSFAIKVERNNLENIENKLKN